MADDDKVDGYRKDNGDDHDNGDVMASDGGRMFD